MKVALITGITGQDGPYLAKFLLSKNYKVIGVVRSYSSSLRNLESLGIKDDILIINADLTDFSSVLNLIRQYAPDEIYNLSAQSSVSLSFAEPIGTISYNIVSVLNLLEAIKLINPSIRFYQASSSDMFGNVQHLPITLQTPMNPLSPYAVSKASAHWSVASYRESYGVYAVSGILFNHESPLRTKTFFLKKIIADAVDIKLGLKENLFVGNLNVKRDFGYAPEYVEAMWSMLQQTTPKDYLICSGKSILLKDIVYFVFDQLNLDKSAIVIDQKLYRPTDIQDIYGDHQAAYSELGWKVSTDFFDVIKHLIDTELTSRTSI